MQDLLCECCEYIVDNIYRYKDSWICKSCLDFIKQLEPQDICCNCGGNEHSTIYVHGCSGNGYTTKICVHCKQSKLLEVD